MKTTHLKVLALSLAAGAITFAARGEQDVITKSFDVKAGGKLIMTVDRGSIHITTSASDKVDIKITRELKHSSASEAKDVFEQHKIELTSKDNEVKIDAPNTQKGFGWNKALNRLQVDY